MHQALSSKHLLNFLCHQYSFPWLYLSVYLKDKFSEECHQLQLLFRLVLQFHSTFYHYNHNNQQLDWFLRTYVQHVLDTMDYHLLQFWSINISVSYISLSPLISLKFVSYLDTFGVFFQEVKYKTCKIFMHLLTAKIWYTHSWMLHSLLLT